MLRETNFLLFLAASLPLILTPGPDMIYVATRGIARGRGVALISASGVGLGYVVHTVLAVAGLSALLQQSATAFLVVKYVGAAYLLYLGVRTLFDRGASHLFAGREKRDERTTSRVFSFRGRSRAYSTPRASSSSWHSCRSSLAWPQGALPCKSPCSARSSRCCA